MGSDSAIFQTRVKNSSKFLSFLESKNLCKSLGKQLLYVVEKAKQQIPFNTGYVVQKAKRNETHTCLVSHPMKKIGHVLDDIYCVRMVTVCSGKIDQSVFRHVRADSNQDCLKALSFITAARHFTGNTGSCFGFLVFQLLSGQERAF